MRFVLHRFFFAGSDRLPLRARLSIYFLSFVLFLLVVLFVLIYVFNLSSSSSSLSRKSMGEKMDEYLTVYERNVSLHMGTIVASGQRLAHDVTQSVEAVLIRNNATIADINNNGPLIAMLEYETVPLLSQSLRESRSTGAFVVLDATLNTSLPHADTSRCGVYLKINTPVNFYTVQPPMVWLRGMPQVAAQYNFAVHNRWNMEFDTSRIFSWHELLKTAQTNQSGYFFQKAHYLRGTWEKVLLMCIPLRGRDGSVYGICGLEISSLLFKLVHAHLSPSLPGLTGALALRQQNKDGTTVLDTGAGFLEGPALAVPEECSVYTVTADDEYNRYSDGKLNFVGKEKPLRLSPLPLFGDNAVWVAAVLLPQQQEHAMLMRRYFLVGLFLIAFLIIALLLAIVFSRRCSEPILRGIHCAKENWEKDSTTKIRELDELIAFIKEKEQKLLSQQKAHSPETQKIEQVELGAYRTFIKQIEKLTKTERIVFDLYITGLNSHQIADKLNISINTIRTHNRNIYAKLNVTSYKEMMVYIQMMAGRDQE